MLAVLDGNDANPITCIVSATGQSITLDGQAQSQVGGDEEVMRKDFTVGEV
jgi:hypothetical protein